MGYPTESDYDTELDYVDQDTTNPDDEDDEDSTQGPRYTQAGRW